MDGGGGGGYDGGSGSGGDSDGSREYITKNPIQYKMEQWIEKENDRTYQPYCFDVHFSMRTWVGANILKQFLFFLKKSVAFSVKNSHLFPSKVTFLHGQEMDSTTCNMVWKLNQIQCNWEVGF